MDLSKRIIELRNAKGISQQQLADAMDVSRQSVSKWETGTSIPDLDKLMKLADYFDITLDELVKGKEAKAQVEETKIINNYYTISSSKTKAQKIGLGCLIIATIAAIILIVLFGIAGILFVIPLVLFGTIAYFAKNYPLLKATWATYILMSYLAHTATGVNPYHILYTFQWEARMNYFILFSSWIWFFIIIALLAWTTNTFKTKLWSNSKKDISIFVAAIIVFILTLIPWSFLNNLGTIYFIVSYVFNYLRLFALAIITSDIARIIFAKKNKNI